MSSLSSTASKIRAKAVSISNNKERSRPPSEKNDSEQQMLTADEIADRKRARKALEHKRVALEEAVERRVCESIYNRIWRHRSTTDEEKDEKLRSKTAALSVVGIGLNDLDVDLGQATKDPVAMQTREKEVRAWLEGARDELMAMSNEKYPLGKLVHLKAAHKSIVDTLSHFHPSSSADEIMPMLIYTLITSRPEGIDVISNLHFIQRFRNENKIDGEAAYCLTNLEAAITFLETVDLATLREDEALSGPKSNSRPSTPKIINSMTPAHLTTAGLSPAEVTATSASPTITTTPSSPTGARPSVQHNRSISDMFQPPAVLGAAGDAVLNTADQGFKSIGLSLEGSYKFLLGKLKERQEELTGKPSDIIVPKTLDDARKLVSTPPPEDDASASGASSLHSPENTGRPRRDSALKPDDKMLNLIGGRKAAARDRSTDSSQSASSSKKVAFAEEGGEKQPSSPLHPPPLHHPASPANPAIVESMRNLGNSLNPINRFSSMNMTRGFGFGRPPSTPATPGNKPIADGGIADLTSVRFLIISSTSYTNIFQTFPELAPSLPPKEIPKIAPPIKRFMEIQNPGDMKLNEVLELLRDYRRLAGALKDIGAV